MKIWKIVIIAAVISILAGVTGCQKVADELIDKKPEGAKKINITMIAKRADNPVFLSARAGAEAAAKNISEKYSMVDVAIDWRTPPHEDAQIQADRIRTAVLDGTDAIMVSCSDDSILTAAINAAVDSGVPVMTFDSDAPHSKRFAFYGPNDVETGEKVMTELIGLMGEQGRVAILAGNPGAPNLQKRVQGVQTIAAKHAGIEIVGIFYHDETAEAATAEVVRVNALFPDLKGWAMVGGWPLFSDALMSQIDPAKIKIVAVDALPVQLTYIEKGIVPVLLGQPTYRWGEIPVEKIVDKLHFDKQVPVMNEMKLIRVSKDNLGGWARQLRAWGYEDVPREYLTYVAD